MLSFIKKVFQTKPEVNYKDLVAHGAQLIDVRTPAEFKQGHLRGAINIPLQILGDNLSKIRKDKPVITYCASGMRSAAAKSVLINKGFDSVYNGGGYHRLENLLRK
ncbi:MAG TPA: rhodanese-like domain-containing protein [Saprospiraceae bacterium]|nr:rhodanese-like domain-containing protein [Saprospiraceae bacterium]